MFEMKVLRVRLRSIVVLGILAALTVVFLYLPPVYRSTQFLISSTVSPVGHAEPQPLRALEIEKELPEALPHSEEKEILKPDIPPVLEDPQEPSKGNQEGLPPKVTQEPPEKILQPTEPEVEHPLQDKNEHDSYVQDYPDYTPAGFVEVKKNVPSAGKNEGAQGQKEKEKEITKKKPGRLKTALPTTEGNGLSKLTPQVLRNRALSSSSNSSLRLFLEEQDRRVQHVATVCPGIFPPAVDVENRGMGPPPGLAGAHNLLLDRANHIAFCPVFKAASTSWTITLLEIGGFWNKKQRKNRRLQTLVDYVFPKISNFAGPAITREMTRFMVVRHPFERLLSCYRDKFESAKKDYYYTRYGEKMIRFYRKFPEHITSSQLGMLQEQVRAKVKAHVPVHLPGNPFAEPLGPTFEEFVRYILHAKFEDEHWRTYYDHCAPCHMSYQFILRFEDLNNEGQEFIEYLNRTSQVHMRWENPTQGGSTTDDVLCSYYNKLTLEMINDLARKYERDFKLFEYKADPYLKCAIDFVKEVKEEEPQKSDG